MHSAPTLGPTCAHTALALRHVLGLAWPCRKLGLAVSQRPRALARHVVGRVLRTVSCTISSRRAPCREPSTSYRGAYPGRVAYVLRYNPTAKKPPYHDTIYCIATHSPTAKSCLRAPLAPRAGRPCRGASRSYRGKVVALSWAWPGRIVALWLRPVSCHVTIQSAVS